METPMNYEWVLIEKNKLVLRGTYTCLTLHATSYSRRGRRVQNGQEN
jgi:hypothetical protein